MKSIYPSEGRVSVWTGTFRSEDEFDAAVDLALVPKLDLPCDIASIAEVAHEDQPVSIRELLTGFSGDHTFIDGTVADARRLGVEFATSALVAYHLEVECDLGPSDSGLCFIGCFVGSDITA